MVLKGIEIRVLHQLEDNTKLDFNEARCDYEKEPCRIASIDCPRPSLPPEIIQYIISIAYREERPKRGGRARRGDRGVRDLLGRVSEFLLSSTNLDVSLDDPDCDILFEATLPLNLNVHFSDTIRMYDHLPIALQHALRWRTLEIQYSPHDSARLLIECKDALPYIENLAFARCGPFIDNTFLEHYSFIKAISAQQSSPLLSSLKSYHPDFL